MDVGANGGDSFIGQPTDDQLINDGKPSVVHGKVVFDPSP